MMNYEKKIQEVARKIKDRFYPDKIILFGSYAWGRPGLDSDVDLFVIKETEDTRELAREMDRFLFPRPFPIDLIVFRPEQVQQRLQIRDFFIEDVLRKGKVLYDRQP